MNHNNQPSDELLQFVFGELDEAGQAAMRQAIVEDAELAAMAQGLTSAVAAVRAENVGQVGDDFNDRLRRRMPEVLDSARAETSRSPFRIRSRATWRWIMRSPVSRVAAAVIFVAAMVGVVVWFHGGGATPAFADFLTPILEAKTLKYKVTSTWTSLPAEVKCLPAEMQQKLLRGTTAQVMMLGADRMRTESEGLAENDRTVQIWDGRLGKSLSLLPGRKQASVSDDANPPKDKKPRPGCQDAAASFRALLLKVRNVPGGKRESLGEKEIDGHRVIGVRISSPEVVMEVWGDPDTGLPARIESTMTALPILKTTESDFEFNVEMDESLFSVEPPAGYEVGSFFIETPIIDRSTTKEEDLIAMFREYSRLSGGPFPPSVEMMPITNIVMMEYTSDRVQKPGAREEVAETQKKLQRGLAFSLRLPKYADAHYAGKGVSLGAADTPVFWYRPKDGKAYRVIYADLTIRDADAPPRAPVALPEQDLIDALRLYSELNDGPFPTKLDMASFLSIAWIKMQIEMQIEMQSSKSQGKSEKPSPEQEREMAEAQTKRQRGLVRDQLRLQQGLNFVGSLPAKADSHYAGRGVSLGATDSPIFWYRPKDSKKYRVIYADLSIRDAEAAPRVPVAMPEKDLIDVFRQYSVLSGGEFPNSLDKESVSMSVSMKLCMKYPPEDGGTPRAEHLRGVVKFQTESQPGLDFAASLPPESDAHYAGRGVSLGAVDRPIFWYRPKDAKKYRVIYADLSVRDADTPPNVPVAPPEQDLIDTLRYYSELNGGIFPGSLDKDNGELSPVLEKKFGLKKEQKPNAKQTQEILEISGKFLPGKTFLDRLPPSADAHYAGKGVSLGTPDTPIFWYRPKDAKTYRVIYADLSVREADAPPRMPNAQPAMGETKAKK